MDAFPLYTASTLSQSVYLAGNKPGSKKVNTLVEILQIRASASRWRIGEGAALEQKSPDPQDTQLGCRPYGC